MHSLYIHVPFCQKRCHYCGFYSTTLGSKERALYVKALIDEMSTRACGDTHSTEHNNRLDDGGSGQDGRKVLTTVYFGGGTPSQLCAEEQTAIFEAIHRLFMVAQDAEITFECNPDDVTAPFAEHLAALGVNRVSMGVQSFDDAVLTSINRRHTAAQAHEAIEKFHAAGIHNISIDLIYGLPGQTLTTWRKDVAVAVALSRSCIGNHPAVTHVSSYGLSIEEGTPLYNMRARGEIDEVSDDTSLDMYNYLVDSLTAAGFEHYEISNFARPGYRSRHNSHYWTQAPYIGLGPGAHSYDGQNIRRSNHPSLHDYIQHPNGAYDEECLSESERYDELIMTRLRTSDGLPLKLLNERQRNYLLRMAQPYLASGHLVVVTNTDQEGSDSKTATDVCHEALRLTRTGIFISDSIFAELMSDE